MDMQTDHPEFDRDMELLCTLPRDPHSVPADLVACDLDYGTPRQVTAAIKRLRERGYLAHQTNSGLKAPRELSVERFGWSKAQRDGGDYWRRVYDKASVVAA